MDYDTVNWAQYAEAVAAEIFGQANAALSHAPDDVRFGNCGSVSINYEDGTWYDFENERGGGIRKLIKIYKEIEDRDEAIAFAEKCLENFERAPRPTNGGTRPNGSNNGPRSHEELEAVYSYQDASGQAVLKVFRFLFREETGGYATGADGKRKKTFKQHRMRGDTTPIIPYRLPELLEAIAAKFPICIVEGEKKVDCVRGMGFAATCCAGGAKSWKLEHSAFLRGADVVLLPDNDAAGREHVEMIAESLSAVATRTRILTLPGLPEKGDVVDWVAAGGTPEEFKRLLYAAPEHEHETPQPLMRPLPPAAPFPLEALGPELAAAALAIHALVQSPLEMCAGAVLASASFAISAHVDVVLPTGQTRPTCCWFWCVALSGERKTATDELAFAPQMDREKKLHALQKVERKQYEVELAAWQAQSKAIEKQFKNFGAAGSDAHKQALEELGPAPEEPLGALLTSSEFTFEGLVRCLGHGQPLYGIIGSEGGQFLGGHGMTDEAKLRTIAGLSAAWDGVPIKRVRAAEAIILHGRRVGMHLMVQPEVAAAALGDALLQKQGFLSRVFVNAPESLIGQRLHKLPPPEAERDLARYQERLRHILEVPYPLAPDTRNELQPRAVPFSARAQELFWDFCDTCEKAMAEGGAYETIVPFAAKLPEHAGRLAAALAAYRDLAVAEIDAEYFLCGVHLAAYYASEAIRTAASGWADPNILQAQKMLDWLLHDWPKPTVAARDLYTYGPSSIRDPKAALALAETLAECGWLIPIKPRRRDMKKWQINRGA